MSIPQEEGLILDVLSFVDIFFTPVGPFLSLSMKLLQCLSLVKTTVHHGIAKEGREIVRSKKKKAEKYILLYTLYVYLRQLSFL